MSPTTSSLTMSLILTPSATSASILSLVVSALSYILLYVASAVFPLFDKSPLLVSLSPTLNPLLRWDSFHFFHIAQSGYLYEHEWAFFPATPALVRYLHPGGLPLMLVLAASPSLAYMTVVISLLSSSPVTMRLAPYSEPFFTYLSYRGMLCCARKKWLLATVLFTLASSFRSNGFLLSGYILWGQVMQPILTSGKVALSALVTAIISTSIVFVPFMYHNYTAYTVFCKFAVDETPSWCADTLPCIYTYSQSRYWNVGFLRYWSFSQVPNFVIASPLFLLIANFAIAYIRYHLAGPKPFTATCHMSKPFYQVSLFPYVVHSVVLSLMLLLSAHSQIILRLAPSVPIVYWAAAHLVAKWPTIGRQWVTWSAVWGIVSITLWSAFLPPA
ncbi:hypothetical protein APHAL10511_000089 [Amanita phalloides]|nr:hypothetical protein APHAL10511_000089 [Amanita phalloides]